MSLIQLGPNRYDVASPAEVRSIMAEENDKQRERARGIKDVRKTGVVSPVASTHVTLSEGICPEAGYKWVVRMISVYLTTAGTGQAYITSDSGVVTTGLSQSFLGLCVASFATSGAYQVATMGNGACVLGAGEGLYLNFTQSIGGYMISGWQVPAERIAEFA